MSDARVAQEGAASYPRRSRALRVAAPPPVREIPPETLVVVARGRQGEQLGVTTTPFWGMGRWPFVLRWMGDRWTKKPAKARVLRLATVQDLQTLLAAKR